MSIGPLDRFFSLFKREEPPAPAAAEPVKKLALPPSSKPIPIPGVGNSSLKTRDQNSVDDVVVRMLGTLSLKEKRFEEEFNCLNNKLKSRLNGAFHQLSADEIEKVAYQVVTHSAFSTRQGVLVLEEDKDIPRTIHVDYDNKRAVVCLETAKGTLPQYITNKLRTTRAILIRWDNLNPCNSLNTTLFRVHNIFQNITLDTLSVEETHLLKPLEVRVAEEDRRFFPAYYGSYIYQKAGKVKNCFLTAGYDMSVHEAVLEYDYAFKHIVAFAKTLLGKLQIIHRSGLEHRDICLNKIFMVDVRNVELTGYECAREGDGKVDLNALGVVLEQLVQIVHKYQKLDRYGLFLLDLIANLKSKKPLSAEEALAYF